MEETTMNGRYLDDYLPVIAIQVAVEEKTRVAEMAAATLRKLHNVIQQMKNWRDDSARLKSNIWRMKMALRADDKNGDDNQEIDPLIAHQRAEISRLEEVNDALGNEVASLKHALSRAEKDIARIAGHEAGDGTAGAEDESPDDKGRERCLNDIPYRKQHPQEKTEESRETRLVLRRLGDRLEKFARDDRAFEVMLACAIGKVVETIVHLSEELVNVNEDLYRFKTKNRNLHRKLDRLKAMLRSRSGNSAEYRKRIGELNNLAEKLMGEMGRLKIIHENANCDGNLEAADVVTQVEQLMNDLKDNLKSEREAMIAAGDPDRLRYMKKVIDLKVSLRVLAVELRRSNSSLLSSLHKRSLGDGRCARTASLLDDFLKEMNAEIGKLKVTPMGKYCRIGGISGSRYMTKVAELEDLVKNSATVIAALRRRDPPGTANIAEEATQELSDSIERLCRKIRDLEVLDDRVSLRERIGRLETSIVRLRLELTEKNDRVDALNDECARVRLTLENERDKYREIVAKVRRENECLREDASGRKREISELSRLERMHLEQHVAEMRLMTVEIDALRKELRKLRDDKETLSGETETMRNILRERDKETANIIAARDSLRVVLGTEVKDLKMRLGIVSDENVKLKSIIGGLGKRRRRERQRLDKLKSSTGESDEGRRRQDNGKSSREDCAPNLRDELERLKAESNESKISLNEANRRIDRLERALDEAVGDRTKLQAEVSDLKSNEESLTYRLNAQTSAGEEAAREYERVTEANKALEGEVKHLRNEKEQLGAELSELKIEKGSLVRSMDDANNKCAALQDQVNKFKSERNGLHEEIRERSAAAGNLKFELKRTRTELEDAAVHVARLKADSSRLAGDLDALSAARSAEADDRVRVLLTEKNELMTRINELDDENAMLRDRLNKVKTENEYFSIELNKSRVENDKVEAKNALLQVTCDRRASENEALKRERDEARRRLNETGSEPGTPGDRREIQWTSAAASSRENNDRGSHSRRIDTRYPLAKSKRHERGFADAYNKVRYKQDCSNAARTDIKVEIGEQKDDETAFKAESDTCANPDNKAKIKDKPKGSLKRPRIEDKALKLEQANLRLENADVAVELACGEDESKNPIPSATGELGDKEIIDSVAKSLRDFVNIRYTRRTSNYAGHSGDAKMLKDEEDSQMPDIDQLQVESRALKMEVDILRDDLEFSLTNCGRTRAELAKAMEEIRALKSELMNLRDEKTMLRSRLEAFKEESDRLKFERTALKDELVASRKSNFDLRLKANDLRSAVEKLKGTNARLEDGLRNALKETNERNAASDASDSSSRNIFRGTSHAGGEFTSNHEATESIGVRPC